MKLVIIFLISLWIPLIYWHLMFYLFKNYFNKLILRTKTGLQIHHFHHGIVLILLASLWLLFSDKNVYIIILLGLGLGLVVDEFISSLIMPGNRPLELKIYGRSLYKTLWLFIFLTVATLLVAFVRV